MIRHSKKIFILTVLVLLVLLSGCGKNLNTGTEMDTASDVATDTTIDKKADNGLDSETNSEIENEDSSQQVSEETVEKEIEEASETSASLSFEELTDVESISDSKYTCSYENEKHDFLVYLPENTDNAPFVIMLHGYGESGESFCSKVHFEEKACAEGFAVIYARKAPGLVSGFAGRQE